MRRIHAAHHTACRVLLEKKFPKVMSGLKLIIVDNAIDNKEDFTEKVKDFSQILLARGSTQTEINNATHKVSLANRAKLIHKLSTGKQNKEVPLVFSTTYNPFVNHKDVKQAVNKNT